ncbi:MAG: HEAT repeat domain-containing protein [Planctomycetes bacterium]|nr:HEAT repeat domain-containing protein [Planctomycetota bacterium]
MRRTGFLTGHAGLAGHHTWVRLLGAVALAWGCASGVPASAQQGGDAAVAIPADATPASLFTDFLHYARLGRFTMADTYARALLARPDLNPVELLEVANRDKKSVDTLLIIIKNSSIGESAVKVLALLEEGEHQRRKDSERITDNIEKLGGNPQQEYRARRHLAESGEYAVPPMVAALSDPARGQLEARIVSALSQIGGPAVGPLAIATAVTDDTVRLNLLTALGELGYPQAIPYLRKLMANAEMPQQTKAAAQRAVERIETLAGRTFPGSPAELFFWLAEKYYNEEPSVRADPRLANANVWYWDSQTQSLVATVIPQRIFGPVMAMRCCEEALLLRNDHAPSIALWLAANIRRESRLGMDIESGDPEELGEPDGTRPAVFPRALYFTQAAGPRYAHLVLDRAVHEEDSAVALGAIEALRLTAGESSLIGTEAYKQPLVRALKFPDLVVRIRAALALGAALPKSRFVDAEHVMPLLARALTLRGQEEFLVVDNDERSLNRVMGALRGDNRVVLGEANTYRAFGRARVEFQAPAGIFLATDVVEPGLRVSLAQLRSEAAYAKTPVVVLVKPTHDLMAQELAKADRYVAVVDASADGAALEAALQRVRNRTNQTALNTDLALSLALEAARTLHAIAVDGRTVYAVGRAERALTTALASDSEELQIAVAAVLAHVRTSSAQASLAQLGLDAGQADSLRLSALHALTASAKNNGHPL